MKGGERKRKAQWCRSNTLKSNCRSRYTSSKAKGIVDAKALSQTTPREHHPLEAEALLVQNVQVVVIIRFHSLYCVHFGVL